MIFQHKTFIEISATVICVRICHMFNCIYLPDSYNLKVNTNFARLTYLPYYSTACFIAMTVIFTNNCISAQKSVTLVAIFIVFFRHLRQMTGEYLKLDNSRFLSHPSQQLIQYSSSHSTL